MTTTLLSLRLSVDYDNRPGCVKEVSLSLEPGEILGLVGQSGSGKSTIALAILGLLAWRNARSRGHILFENRDLLRLPEREMRSLRGRQISLVPQSPIAALNPALRLRRQFQEAWFAHSSERDWRSPLLPLLRAVQLPEDDRFLDSFPRQLSVGLAQRVLIAMALLHRPSLLIADEPTSALDAITSAEILALFSRLNHEFGTSILFISHDLLSVATLCHRVAILAEGELVETGTTRRIFEAPEHSYTRKLIGSLAGNPFAGSGALFSDAETGNITRGGELFSGASKDYKY